jgi:hypothetical protein
MHGLTGQIAFEIEALTPICVHHNPSRPDNSGRHRFAHLGDVPVLPATSLKGMLRSVHEVVTNSTLGLLGLRRGRFAESVPEGYRPGQADASLTPSEALFGMVGGEGSQSVGYAGRLFVDDLPLTVDLVDQRVSRPQGGQPKPDHESFYFMPGPGGRPVILGRKFYYHQRDYREVLRVYREDRGMKEITVQAIPPKALLAGTLRFLSLERDELAALIYSLILEPNLAHKLGYGKPLGLGSLRIRVKQLEVEPAATGGPARFLSYDDAPAREDWTDQVIALRDEAQASWLARGPAGGRSYAAFAAITRWPQEEDFIYPNFISFFRPQRSVDKQMTLWEYQGRKTMHPPDGVTGGPGPAPLHGGEAQASKPSVPPERRQGLLGRDGGFYVHDTATGNRVLVFTGGTNKALLRGALGRLEDGARLPVSYLLRHDGGTSLAHELKLEEGGDA